MLATMSADLSNIGWGTIALDVARALVAVLTLFVG